MDAGHFKIKHALLDIFYSYQKEFILDKSKYIIVLKCRQSGFSFAAAFRAVIRALSGVNQVILSTNIRNARRLLKTCKKAIKVYETVTEMPILLISDNSDEIEFANGCKIVSLANNPDTAVGEAGDLIIDEASRFRNHTEIKDAVYPFISRGYSLCMISTPLGKRGLFWDTYLKATKEGTNWKLYNIDVNKAIKAGAPIDISKIKEELDEFSFRQNYLCEFLDDESSFFSFDLVESVIDSELKNFSLQAMENIKTEKIGGYDPGKKVDSGVFVVMDRPDGITKRLLHIKEFVGVPYSEQIVYITECMKFTKIGRLYVDATGVGEPVFETFQRLLGSCVKPIVYTNAVKEHLVTDLKMDFEKRLIRIPDNEKLKGQLYGIERVILDSGLTKYGHKRGGHDDIVMAIANAVSGFTKIKSSFNDKTVKYVRKLKMASFFSAKKRKSSFSEGM